VPDRDAGTSHGHASAAHTYPSSATRYTGLANRHASAPACHADAVVNGHASAPARHADAAATTHRYADLFTNYGHSRHTRHSAGASCDWGGRRRGASSSVDTDGGGGGSIGLRRSAFALAKAEGMEEIAVFGTQKITRRRYYYVEQVGKAIEG
jgi:hypothetical protein